jgi:hypothetical protein
LAEIFASPGAPPVSTGVVGINATGINANGINATGINDKGGKFATGTACVVDTGGKFATGVNEPGGK